MIDLESPRGARQAAGAGDIKKYAQVIPVQMLDGTSQRRAAPRVPDCCDDSSKAWHGSVPNKRAAVMPIMEA
jgi:hypothetical protein